MSSRPTAPALGGPAASLPAACATLLLAALSACSRPADALLQPADTPPAHRPNVVVYLIDTLRADALGVYGSPAGVSPGIDDFARGATVFENALSQAPWTLPSVTSLYTSTYPASHRILDHFDRVGPQAETMAEFLHELGYHTVGFAANTLGGQGAGLDQGFDEFTEHQLLHTSPEERAAGPHQLQPLYDWLAQDHGDQPQFVYVHTVEPHDPYEGVGNEQAGRWSAPRDQIEQLQIDMAVQRRLDAQRFAALGAGLSPEDSRLLADATAALQGREQDARDLYDGDVREASDNFQRFVEQLARTPGWEDAIVVLLADHGEEFGEHGSWFHGHSVYQELLHVPLLVRVPGLTDAGARIRRPVQLIDVLPTLAELLGVPARPHWQGHSLVPLLRGESEEAPRPALAMRIFTDQVAGERGRSETALVDGRWKLIVHHDVSRTSLFDLGADPREQQDLSSAQPERVRAMLDVVQRTLHELPRLPLRSTEAPDEQAEALKLQHLQDLGYVERASTR